MSAATHEHTYNVPRAVDRAQSVALIVGVVALVVSLALSFVSPGGFPVAFWRPYLIAFVFWTGVAVGSLPLMMLHHLTGGGWGLPIRRPMEGEIDDGDSGRGAARARACRTIPHVWLARGRRL